MLFDHAKAAREKERLKQFEEMKKFLSEHGAKHEFPLALEQISVMENTLAEQKKSLEGYQKWFDQLDHYLPRRLSIHDRIG